MNYFGFRKIAGKGKMAPCSYVNEAAKDDISSLLFIKRKKTGVSSSVAKLIAQHNRMNAPSGGILAAGQFPLLGAGVGGAMGGVMGMGGVANASLALHNLQGIGGIIGGGGGNTYTSKVSGGISELALLREQQQMLSQLQQAHASATNGVGMGGLSAGNLVNGSGARSGLSSLG